MLWVGALFKGRPTTDVTRALYDDRKDVVGRDAHWDVLLNSKTKRNVLLSSFLNPNRLFPLSSSATDQFISNVFIRISRTWL